MRTPSFVSAMISSCVGEPFGPALEDQAHVGRRRRGFLFFAARCCRVVEDVLQHTLLDPGDRLRRAPIIIDRRLTEDRVADVALQREAVAEQLLPDLRRAVGVDERPADAAEVEPATTSAASAEATATAASIECAHHRRQEPRRRPRLENRRVAPRFDRARLLTFHRLVGRDFGQLWDVDL
jgi:hypothetical protein